MSRRAAKVALRVSKPSAAGGDSGGDSSDSDSSSSSAGAALGVLGRLGLDTMVAMVSSESLSSLAAGLGCCCCFWCGVFWSWIGSRVCSDLIELSLLLSSQFCSSGVEGFWGSCVFNVMMEPSDSVSCCSFPSMVAIVRHEISESESLAF